MVDYVTYNNVKQDVPVTNVNDSFLFDPQLFNPYSDLNLNVSGSRKMELLNLSKLLTKVPYINLNTLLNVKYNVGLGNIATTEGRAKLIFNFLKQKGIPDTNILGIMANCFRMTDGTIFPFEKLTIDTGHTVGGGIRGLTGLSMLSIARKYNLRDAESKIMLMEAYAKKSGVKILSKEAERLMNTKFPEGCPIPVEYQLLDLYDDIKKKCPLLLTLRFDPAEASRLFRLNVNNPGLVKKYGRSYADAKGRLRWEHHGKDICRFLGIKQL